MDTSPRTPLWVHLSIRALRGIVFFSAAASKLVEGSRASLATGAPGAMTE